MDTTVFIEASRKRRPPYNAADQNIGRANLDEVQLKLVRRSTHRILYIEKPSCYIGYCHDIWYEATAAKTMSRSPFMLSAAAHCKQLPSCVIAHLYLDSMSSHNAESVNTRKIVA
eukprot:2890960-Amphidinium_carterae.1